MTHAMLRRLTSWRCIIIIIIKADTSAADVTSSQVEKLPGDLTGDQLFQVQLLLHGYDDVVSHGAFDMGRTT